MEQYMGILIPIIVSFISAVFTGMFLAGRNIEKLRTLEDAQHHQEAAIQELVRRIAKIEGIHEVEK